MNSEGIFLPVVSGMLIGIGAAYTTGFYLQHKFDVELPGFMSKIKINQMAGKKAQAIVARTLNEECVKYQIEGQDRNEDGELDLKYVYYEKEIVESHEDRNFDGRFETETVLENAVRLWSEIDTDGDEVSDMEVRYKYDRPEIIIIKDTQTGRPLKIKQLSFDKLVLANVDTDRNGEIDTAYTYDGMEEVSGTYDLAKYPEKRIGY